MGVNMNDFSSPFLSSYDIRKCYRVCFCHITAHDQDSITIDEVLWKGRGTTTPKCYTQTGYSRAVSYTGLVLNRDDP